MKDYINDRKNGMYSILESSVVYEAATKKQKEDAERSF